MRIVILIPTIKPGGAEKQAALLAKILNEEHEVHFIALYGRKDLSMTVQNYLNDANVSVHFLSGRFFNKWKELFLLIKHFRFDIAFNYLTLPDVIGAMVEKIAGVKKVFNGIRNSRLAPAKTMMEWFAHNFVADYTVYNCNSGADYFANLGFNKKKSIVIHNCFPNISPPIHREDRQIKKIITVGRFEPQKDYLTLIKTIANLRLRRSDFSFIIIGHGHLEGQIRSWLHEYSIDYFTDVYIAPNNVQDILREADIYISTSLFEGTSNSIMEAMNWSMPIIATNVGDNSVLVKQGINGYLSSTGDCLSLSKGLEELLSSYERRVHMGLQSNCLLHDFSVENFREKYENIIKGQI